ncbi:coiled-coil domain-containing protein 148 isoform X1 [Lepisosteus oculatus]|uniref:coiled-coil domain-containing protein 148 isoform X1 n=2 Tax=Lepisosteus oculatus TaxID=7918 RepID=UPI0035F5257B
MLSTYWSPIYEVGRHKFVDINTMSGRDLRMFITNHRVEDIERLTLRMKDGLGSKKYKPVDYQQLQAITEAKRFASANIELKIHKTLQAARMTKENTVTRQHRQVWCKEYARLMKAGQRLDLEIQKFLDEEGINNDFLFQMKDNELQLEKERSLFRADTVDPIWQLKDDLRSRLSEMCSYTSQHPLKTQSIQCDLILEQVEYVKKQQKDIIEKLDLECLSVEEEISATRTQAWLSSTEEIRSSLQQIPEEVLNLECPYPDLKESLLKEFQSLDEKYSSRLQNITERLNGLDRCCGWSETDHLIFQSIVDQYPHDMKDRRVLYMDMLHRLFPHKSRQELSDHERHWDWYRFTVEQKKAVLQGWTRDRTDLLMKAVMTLEEACSTYDEEVALRMDRRHQQKVCAELKEKLRQWRAHQEEVARLEGAIAARKQEEEEDRLRAKQQKDEARRNLQKEKIKRYYTQKQSRRDELERRDRQRLEELKGLLAEQARKDQERVQFRQDLLQQRRKEKESQALRLQEQEEERQRRLENLRNQVAVVADLDPVRLMGATKSSKARQNIEAEEEVALQRPLFHLYTYTDTEILSDQRVRIEQALRQAGLHNTFYAKDVLSNINPPRPPRRDMESTLFQNLS